MRDSESSQLKDKIEFEILDESSESRNSEHKKFRYFSSKMILISGITIAFIILIITSYMVGRHSAYAINPTLEKSIFHRSPTPVPTPRDLRKILYKEMIVVDLDGDGKDEEIYVAEIEEPYKRTTVLIDQWYFPIDGELESISIADIYKDDNQMELVIALKSYNNYEVYSPKRILKYFSYVDKQIHDLGTFKIRELKASDDGYVEFNNTSDIFQPWEYHEKYFYNKDNMKLELVNSNDCFEYSFIHKHTILKEFKLQKSREDNTVIAVLKPGDEIALIGCDNVKWCLARTSDGREGWFSVDVDVLTGINEGNEKDFFDGLSDM